MTKYFNAKLFSIALQWLSLVSPFCSREAAEEAARRAFNRLEIKGHKLRVLWGRGRGATSQTAQPSHTATVPGLPAPLPVPDFSVCCAL
jgi:hypothetical protein